jgi:hypothetical protein
MKKRCPPTCLPLALLLALSGCQPKPASRGAGPLPSPANSDSGLPLTLQFELEARVADGGVFRAALDMSTAAVVPVTQSLDVTANLPLHNYRLRILDEIDRALASNDVPEETPSGLRYHIALLTPLRSGHRYVVLLDAQSGATLDNGSGVAFDEQRFEFRTEGERAKDAPAKGPVKRHSHRRSGP